MNIQIDSVEFEYITLYCDGYKFNEESPSMMSVNYTLSKGRNKLSGVLSLGFDEYKDLTYNNLIDKVKGYVTQDM